MNILHNVFQKLCPHKWCTCVSMRPGDDWVGNFLVKLICPWFQEIPPCWNLEILVNILSSMKKDLVSFPWDSEVLHREFDLHFPSNLHPLLKMMWNWLSLKKKLESLFSLFRNKRFALNEMFQRNASKFAIFYV